MTVRGRAEPPQLSTALVTDLALNNTTVVVLKHWILCLQNETKVNETGVPGRLR